MVGTPHYMPPEWFEQGAYTQEGLTIWTIGCVLYVLLAGCPPYPSTSLIRSQNRIDDHPVMSQMSESCRELLIQLMHPFPANRLKLESLESYPFLANYTSGRPMNPLIHSS